VDPLRLGIAFHEKYGLYDFGPGHPFRGDRFEDAMKFFKENGLLKSPNVSILKPKPAEVEDLMRVHIKSYIDLIFEFAEKNRAYDLDTPVSPTILEGSLHIMGGALKIGEALFSDEIDRGVCLGGGLHHAGADFGGGFCLFNDVAILARFLQEEKGIKRVLVLDYDVHAGNGTSDIFYSDPSVLFISVHQDPKTLFPGTGFIEQIGRDEGRGFNINLPLPPGTGSATYFHALREIFVPLASEFKADVILANGGSDPHFADILGGLGLTVHSFFDLSRLIAEVAQRESRGKAVLLVGSGYNPQVLPACWFALTTGFAGWTHIDVADPSEPLIEPPWCQKRVDATVKELKRILSDYWECFR
jgi:acetoin utilization protein AcuC